MLFIKQCFLICSVETVKGFKQAEVEEIENGKIMLSSNYAVCGSKKSRFIKEQEIADYYIT